jgi:transcriptional regulator with XRE-family HTH domain
MARKWKDLRAEFEETDEDRAAIVAERAKVEQEIFDYNLAELRKALDLTQAEMARRLDLPQSNVSRIENQDDVLLSTLGRYVTALGGELEVNIRFKTPDESENVVPIRRTAAVKKTAARHAPAAVGRKVAAAKTTRKPVAAKKGRTSTTSMHDGARKPPKAR